MNKKGLRSFLIFLAVGILGGIFALPLVMTENAKAAMGLLIVPIVVIVFLLFWILLAVTARPFKPVRVTLESLLSAIGIAIGAYLSPWI